MEVFEGSLPYRISRLMYSFFRRMGCCFISLPKSEYEVNMPLKSRKGSVYNEAARPITVHGCPRLSAMVVRLLYGLKNMAIDLCEKMSIMAFRNLMPCTASMSPGELFVLNSQRRFLSSEKAVHQSSGRRRRIKT